MKIPTIHPGTLPGTLIAPLAALDTVSKAFVYSANQVTAISLDDLLSGQVILSATESIWISIVGLKNLSLIKQLGDFYHLHALALEDVLGSHQRPKVDVYDHYEFIVCKLVKKDQKLTSQQLSLFVGQNFIISFLEHPSSVLMLAERNLLNPQSKLIQRNVDYFAYQIIDIVIDNYFVVISEYSDKLDHLEEKIFTASSDGFIRELQRLKRDIRSLKLYTWSHRDLLNNIIRNDQNTVKKEEVLYFRDCYDHTVQQIDIIESLRERSTSLLDIYLSTVTNRLNQVMKILTIISVVFMPPCFLAAVWGMNFKDMPELHWNHGYVYAWLTMLSTSGLSYLGFWHYGWLRNTPK